MPMDLHATSKDQRQEVGEQIRFTFQGRTRQGTIDLIGAQGRCLIVACDDNYVVLTKVGHEWTWAGIPVRLEA
jgi:hypothetical protein